MVRKRQVFGIKYVIVVKYYSHLDNNRDFLIYICIWLLFGDRTIVFFHEKIMRFDRSNRSIKPDPHVKPDPHHLFFCYFLHHTN